MKHHDDERDERTDDEEPRREASREARTDARERRDAFDLDPDHPDTFRIPRI